MVSSSTARTFRIAVFSFEQTVKSIDTSIKTRFVFFFFADSNTTTLTTRFHLFGSVFTDLALTTSWIKMKAIKWTNSSLITPSLFFVLNNTSGTNYAFLLICARKGKPRLSVKQ